jgi:aerobic carbon-monoxide dehydrogenase large subunit
MSAGHAGGRTGRVEDARLLTGRGQFTDDIHLDRMVHAAFVRSPMAHAEIAGIDTRAAIDAGALLVLTARDLPFIGKTLISRFAHPSIREGVSKLLALDRVRFVGEAVALVVAEDRYRAEDLAELVEVDYRPLPAVATMAAAMAPGASALHPAWTGNVAAAFKHETGDADAALRKCARRLKRRFVFGRQTALPLETRGCVADFDVERASLTVWLSTQTHYNVRQNLAALLDIPEFNVRVVAEDVGGGFGGKSRPYAEEVLVSHASRVLGRPVKWIEDRFEHMFATTHSRAMETEVEFGYDEEGRIRALKGRLLVDVGAYVFTSGIVTAQVASGQCAGPYKIENIALDVLCVGTNKTPLATYRGAGQPEATFPLECMIDLIAADLNLPAPEVRLRNIVAPADMPYKPFIPYGGPQCRFESGDFPALVRRAVAESGYDEKVARGERERSAWGLAVGIESTGFVGFESAEVKVDGAGKVTVWSGMSSQGQGQHTTYAEVCARTLGVDAANVTVRMGDTRLLPFGRGAFASRGAVVGANAVAGAASRLREKALALAGTLLQCDPATLTIARGRICRASGEATSIALGDVAQAIAPGAPLYSGQPALAEHFIFDTKQTLTFALSVHAARVSVDVRSGFYRLLDYFIIHDAGHRINPQIVDGQIIGGAVDGIGGATLSELIYDDQAQPLAGTLADYLVITAPEAPRIRLAHAETRPTTNPLGVRGVGEGGTIPASAAIVNAVARAIGPNGAGTESGLFRLPLRPEAVLAACDRAARIA